MNKEIKKRAVVIDTDQSLLCSIALILQKRGYEVYTAQEPLLCPIYLDSQCPCPDEHTCTNIVMLNINMRSITGFNFVESQKQKGCKVENIAVMSVIWDAAERQKYEKLGCKVLTKPFKMEELADWLQKCESGIKPHSKLSQLP